MSGGTIDWGAIRLVIFDVDGTLYDQRAMRLRMLRELAGHALSTRSLAAFRALSTYRRLRENLGGEEIPAFEDLLVTQTAAAVGISSERVRSIVDEWIHQRPLRHLRACRYPHVTDLFVALKSQGKRIGIFSDYPSVDKLAALELSADYVVAAGDPEVGILKPHPRGLDVLMKMAGVVPRETVFVGDRIEKDGDASRRAGVTALIRSSKPRAGWLCFPKFDDALFTPLFRPAASTR